MRNVRTEMAEERRPVLSEGSRAGASMDNPGGTNWYIASIFLVCFTAGSGFLAIPKAVENAGNFGLVLLLVFAAISFYTCHILSDCWLLAWDQHSLPERREQLRRNPYATIAEITHGKCASYIVSASINFTLFGSAVVYLLLSVDNICNIAGNDGGLVFCYIVPIIGGGTMVPLIFFKSTKDKWFWPLAFISAAATVVSVVLLAIELQRDGAKVQNVTHTPLSTVALFMSFGTLCFAWGGQVGYPSFQAEMYNSENFKTTLSTGFIVLVFIYTPCTFISYYSYGDAVTANIIDTIDQTYLSVVRVLMALHFVVGIVIALNPVCKDLECKFGLREGISVCAGILRCVVMVFVITIAMFIPHFDTLISLLGGTTIAFLMFVTPPIFHWKLRRCRSPEHSRVTLPRVLLDIGIICIGLIIPFLAAYGSFKNNKDNFGHPCFWNMTQIIDL